MFSCWCSQLVSYHAGSVKNNPRSFSPSVSQQQRRWRFSISHTALYILWKLDSCLNNYLFNSHPRSWMEGDGGTLISHGHNRTMEKIAKTYSPLCCPPVCTASSCVLCHWTSAGRMSANPSCHNGLVWQQLWSWCARLSRPPTTDTCLRWEETSLQLLQTDVNKKKTPFVDKWCIRCPCRLDEMK